MGCGRLTFSTVRKGDTITEFLRAVKQQLASEFRVIRNATVENLVYVKEDLLIPHQHSFYELIINKARGKSGPVSGEGSRESVDAGCRKLTASWVKALALDNPNIQSCSFFEGYDKGGTDVLLPSGVYTLLDLQGFGREKGWCPYFLARHMIQFGNVVVYNY